MNSSSLIELETTDGIATLWLNRPEKRNAMSDDMRTEFIAALEHVANDKAIRALVLTGRGKGFCAGGDVAGMERRMQAPAGEVGFNGWSRQQRVHHTQSLLHTMPKPTIAAVNGAAWAWAPTRRWPATSSSRRMPRASPGPTSIAASCPMAAACTSCRAGSGSPKPRS